MMQSNFNNNSTAKKSKEISQETRDYFDDAGQALFEFSCSIWIYYSQNKIVVHDSRDLSQAAIQMSHDFHEKHRDTDWTEEDFINECDQYFLNNIFYYFERGEV